MILFIICPIRRVNICQCATYNNDFTIITLQDLSHMPQMYLDVFIVIMKSVDNRSSWIWIHIVSSKLGNVVKWRIIVLFFVCFKEVYKFFTTTQRSKLLLYLKIILKNYFETFKIISSYLYQCVMIRNFVDYWSGWIRIDEIFLEFGYIF